MIRWNRTWGNGGQVHDPQPYSNWKGNGQQNKTNKAHNKRKSVIKTLY